MRGFQGWGVLMAIGVLVGMMCGPAAARDARFAVTELKTGHEVDGDIAVVNILNTETKNFVVKGRKPTGERVFSIYGLKTADTAHEKPYLQITPPKNTILFDYGRILNKDLDSLVFLTTTGIVAVDGPKGEFVDLIEVESIYRHGGNPLFTEMDFARDLNGDGRDDLIVPDFDGFRVLLANEDGTFGEEIFLNMPAEMRLEAEIPSYHLFPMFVFDTNADGRDDIVFLRSREFWTFRQVQGGGFETDPTVIKLPIEFAGNTWREQIQVEERMLDQSNYSETHVLDLKDLNNDNIMDIVTVTNRASGVFNRSTLYGFHFGRIADGTIAYDAAPNSSLTMSGVPLKFEFVDFEQDGRVDIVTGSVRVSITKLISAFLTGSTSVDLSFYRLNGQNRYPDEPNEVRSLPISFDFSSGRATLPLVELVDVTGDSRKDLVLNDGDRGIKVNFGNGTQDIFDTNQVEKRVTVPTNGQLVSTGDLNGDGRTDIMVHFDRLGADGAEKVDNVIVLVAR